MIVKCIPVRRSFSRYGQCHNTDPHKGSRMYFRRNSFVASLVPCNCGTRCFHSFHVESCLERKEYLVWMAEVILPCWYDIASRTVLPFAQGLLQPDESRTSRTDKIHRNLDEQMDIGDFNGFVMPSEPELGTRRPLVNARIRQDALLFTARSRNVQGSLKDMQCLHAAKSL